MDETTFRASLKDGSRFGYGDREIDGITLELTCGACPEQYDAFVGDEQVAYLRLRHGLFTVQMPDEQGRDVLVAHPAGDGWFEDDERERYLRLAVEAILYHIVKFDPKERP